MPNPLFKNNAGNPTMAQLQGFAGSNPLAKQLMSMGSPKAAYDYLMSSNMTIAGKDGRQMTIRDFCNQMGRNPFE